MKKLRLPALLLALLLLVGACSAALAEEETYAVAFLTAFDEDRVMTYMALNNKEVCGMLAAMMILDYLKASGTEASVLSYGKNMYIGQYGRENAVTNVDLYVRLSDDSGYRTLIYYPTEGTVSVWNFDYSEEELLLMFDTGEYYTREYTMLTSSEFNAALTKVVGAITG